MGTPLGPMLANVYMCHLENNCFQNCPQLKPPTYCRYIDDIFIVIDNFKQLENLKSNFEEYSKLSFTYEIESCKELSFLDTIIRRNKEQLRSAVYRKPTNIGERLKYNSICPNKYKTGVIKNFLHRAYNISSDYISLTTEIARIKQLLINNNFPNYLVDQVTKEFINKKQDNKLHAQNKRDTANTEKQNNQVEFYYRNQMTSNYKQVEKELTTIINSNIETTNEAKLKFNIYYKSRKVKNLFIRNNPNKPDQPFNVVYQYTCNQGECTISQSTYIGHTRTTIKERFKQHAAIKKHHQQIHNNNITGSQMLPYVIILATEHNKQDLAILEALLIKQHGPKINRQTEDFNNTLKIF